MGCTSSKKIGATSPTATKSTALDAYRPPPSAFTLFDINSIEEPWLKLESALQFAPSQKTSLVPGPLLDKLDDDDVAPPKSWEEISKAIDDYKTQPSPPLSHPEPPKSSFRTVKDLEKKAEPEPEPEPGLKQLKPVRREPEESVPVRFGSGSEVPRSLRENPFIVKDKMESEKEGKESFLERLVMLRRDPLSGFPEKCPPGGARGVVLYTTSLGGVRKTFEECNKARSILELHRVVFDERDVSLHAEFLSEMRELVAEFACVPRLFIHGRYIGGVEELVGLNESGRLVRILSWARVERGIGWHGCEGCGGARFVPCMECGGSCKVVAGDARVRCSRCNENGLTPCPLCH